MRKEQLYQYTTWGLLVLNLSMISFFFLTKPSPHPRKGDLEFTKRAIEILKLEESQQAVFLESAKKHNQQMEAVNNQQRDLLKPYFQSLIDPESPSGTDSLLRQVELLERKKIELTYQHFNDVKSNLKEDQKAGFEKFMKRALDIILLNQQKRPPPPKDFRK